MNTCDMTDIELSIVQWVEDEAGFLSLGGSDTTELFSVVSVRDEDELLEKILTARTHFLLPGWLDVKMFVRRRKLDLRYVRLELDGLRIHAGPKTEATLRHLDMQTPCGLTLREWQDRRESEEG